MKGAVVGKTSPLVKLTAFNTCKPITLESESKEKLLFCVGIPEPSRIRVTSLTVPLKLSLNVNFLLTKS